MVNLTTVLLCKPTVGQFTITLLILIKVTGNSSGEETTLHEKYAGCDLLSACILSR